MNKLACLSHISGGIYRVFVDAEGFKRYGLNLKQWASLSGTEF